MTLAHYFQVGALEACVLAKNGLEVHLFEYRKGKKNEKKKLNYRLHNNFDIVSDFIKKSKNFGVFLSVLVHIHSKLTISYFSKQYFDFFSV